MRPESMIQIGLILITKGSSTFEGNESLYLK